MGNKMGAGEIGGGQLPLLENFGGLRLQELGERCEYSDGSKCMVLSGRYNEDVSCREVACQGCLVRAGEVARRDRTSSGQGNLYDGMPVTGRQIGFRDMS